VASAVRRQNAEELLAKLLKRHGLTLDDLEPGFFDPREVLWLSFTDAAERQVASQVIVCFCGSERQQFKPQGRGRKIGAEVTTSERWTITIAWEVYRPAWRRALQESMVAFCWRHELVDSNPRRGELPKMTPEQEASARRAAAIAAELEQIDRPSRRLTSEASV
jgi:hypothetical protein